AKYSPTNGVLWAKRFGGSGDEFGNAVAVDRNGDVLVTGTFAGSITFGGATLSTIGGGRGMFVAKLSGATGAHIWSKNLLCGSESSGLGVAVDSAGNALVGGFYLGAVL